MNPKLIFQLQSEIKKMTGCETSMVVVSVIHSGVKVIATWTRDRKHLTCKSYTHTKAATWSELETTADEWALLYQSIFFEVRGFIEREKNGNH